MSDHSADRHPCKRIQQRKDGLKDRAAHILEININPVRTGLAQLFFEIRICVIHAVVESQFVDNEPAFLSRACNPDSTGAFNLRDLSNHRPHRSGGGRHRYGFSRLRFSYVHEAYIGRHPRHTQHTQRG